MSEIEERSISPLPPIICNNPRRKIEPEQVDASTIVLMHHTHREKPRGPVQLVEYPIPLPLKPSPRYPLALTWIPDGIYLELDDEPIIKKLWVLNRSPRPIYIQCCGFWNDTARLGASWLSYPRTRFYLASGLGSMLYIKATPRLVSPISGSMLGLRLAASHLRDMVAGFFIVPIMVEFLKYKEPCSGDG